MNTRMFLRIGPIAGIYYSAGETDAIIIYGIGAPIPPDDGNLPDAPTILNYQTDIFVPDYIGYGRSEGIFTPRNCINTFLNLFNNFKNGCIGVNYYSNLTTKLHYKRIIFIGRSFAGAYIPLLPRYDKQINELAVFCSAVDHKSSGNIAGEETNEEFLNSMKNDGYRHLYRGILSKQWARHLDSEDDLSPTENISYLKNVKLFIAHGMKDTCIHYSRSKNYYQKIIETFPDKNAQYKLKLYENGDHGKSTTMKAAKDFLEWIGVSKRP